MIGSVYDYYLTTYACKPATKNDTHKKSELRSVYNNIVKISKKSPLYKVDISDGMQRYAIDLKENARSLSTDADNLFSDTLSAVRKKKYVSDNESVAAVRTLDNPSADASDIIDEHYDIEVKNLASPQINTSNYLNNSSIDIEKGNHVFEVNIADNTYEFQFKVNNNDSNQTVYEKLSRLINRSNIGLYSEVLYSGNKSALQITSNSTGLGFKPEIFTITPSSEHTEDISAEQLGLNNVTSYPANASFILNGMDKTASSNTFTIGKSLEISLNGISNEGEASSVYLNDDLDSVLDGVSDMVNSYNKLIDLSGNTSEGSDDAARLSKEINKTAKQYKNELESVGIAIGDDGKLSFDNSLFIQSSNEGTLDESLSKLNSFKNGIVAKANDISINPMKYVNKIMISYPNPVKTFANPYITSIYSGMMFNGYI